MTDLQTLRTMLSRADTSFEEETLADEGVVELRTPTDYDESKCEIVFVFDTREQHLIRVLIMKADPDR